MLVNGTDIRKYGAKLLTVKVTPPKMAVQYEMLSKALIPTEYSSDIPLGKLDVTIYFQARNRAELQRTLSSFMWQFKTSVVLDDIKGYKGKYKAYLTEDDYTDTLAKEKKILRLSFDGYFYDEEEMFLFAGKTGGRIYSDGTRDAPCILEIEATKDIENYQIMLNEDMYTVETLKAGKTIVIDGITGLITQNGSNAFGVVNLWSFPKIVNGENELQFSSEDANVTVRYKKMWI